MDFAVFYIIACVVLLLHSVTIRGEEQKPQIITTKNNDYLGYIDAFTGLNCQAIGTNLKYTWKHNDITIDPTYILKYVATNNSTLKPLFEGLDRDVWYQGFYQCFVSNSIGTVIGRRAMVKFTVVGDFYEIKIKESIPAVIGKPFAIHCPRHKPSQNVQYNWLYKVKDADSYLPLPSSSNYFVSATGTLYFSVLQEEDLNFINDTDGIVCHQQASVGSKLRSKQSHLIVLRKNATEASVKTKPEIKAIPSDHQIFTASPPLVIKCGAIGYPIPKLKWYRRDPISDAETEIKTGLDFRLDGHNQSLTIQNIGPDKAGYYKCKAKNEEGEDDASFRVSVSEILQWKAGLEDTVATLYSPLTWTCSASGTPTYHWFKNGVEIWERSRDRNLFTEHRNGKSYLIIKNVTAAYNGMYQCTAANEVHIIYSTGRLQVKVPQIILPPDGDRLIVAPGDDAAIEWKFNTTIAKGLSRTWTFKSSSQGSISEDIAVINPHTHLATIFDSSLPRVEIYKEATLFLRNVSSLYEGTYTFTISGGSDTDTSNVTLFVRIAPRVKNCSSSPTKAILGRSVTITCEASGRPKPTCTIIHNGTDTVGTDLMNETYTIKPLKYSDAGSYQCIANNIFGSSSKTFNLTVVAPPPPPTTTPATTTPATTAKAGTTSRNTVTPRPLTTKGNMTVGGTSGTSGDGISGGAIAGIIIGLLVLLLIILLVVWKCKHSKGSKTLNDDVEFHKI